MVSTTQSLEDKERYLEEKSNWVDTEETKDSAPKTKKSTKSDSDSDISKKGLKKGLKKKKGT